MRYAIPHNYFSNNNGKISTVKSEQKIWGQDWWWKTTRISTGRGRPPSGRQPHCWWTPYYIGYPYQESPGPLGAQWRAARGGWQHVPTYGFTLCNATCETWYWFWKKGTAPNPDAPPVTCLWPGQRSTASTPPPPSAREAQTEKCSNWRKRRHVYVPWWRSRHMTGHWRQCCN